MKKVFEESGKWFLNIALAIAVSFLIQPLTKGEISTSVFVKSLVAISVFFTFGNLLLYISTRMDKDEV